MRINLPFLPFFVLLNCAALTLSQSWVYRKNYVLERNETWGNGHVYLIREEQPFFRVYHPRHMKVAPPERPPPFAGQMEPMNNNSLAPPRRDPLEFELREEKGSDMRLRAAAVFWRNRNRHLHKKNEKMPGGRAKRSLEDYGAQLEARRIEVGEQIARMDRENFPPKIVDSDFVINLPDYEQSQHRLQNSPQLDENAPRMQVLARNQTRAMAKFGHHNLPKGEVKDSVRWPWQIWPYMHCLTMACVCPLFRGTVVGSQCILPNGKPLKRAIRKEFRQYTRAELELFLETMRRFKASGLYSRFGMIHRRSGVHSGPAFFAWHREFLKRLELVFRAMHPENSDPILGLPYWDSTLDGDLPSPEDSIMFSEQLLGEADEAGFVTNGLFANWTTMDGRHSFQRMFGDQEDGEFINDARIDWAMTQDNVDRVMAYSLPTQSCINYEIDERFLEYTHDYVHYLISGDMQERFSSSNDPIFFMHHGFIDSIWEQWRQTKQSRLQRETDYPRNDASCAPQFHFSDAFMPMLQPLWNIDVLSNNYTDNMFEFVARPNCARTGWSEECGNTE
uniref:Tyrosinase copper-binding domain-containing protein n=1 Tax=Globodera rostochiensis TaxID=31243 RepID=A0A914I0C7_GLORO